MSRNVTLYDILISCPGDISKDEITIIENCIQQFNDQFSSTLNVALNPKYWSKSAFAQSGGKPQALLNEQFVKECDAAVAIMWTRFGTPTDEYGSGTEEEIEIMLQQGKQVFMYFSDKPISPSKTDMREYEKVQAFRKKYVDRGIYFTYSTDNDLSRLFYAHLTKFFLTKQKDEEIIREPQLMLKAIDEKGNLSDSFRIYPFESRIGKYTEEYVKEIKALYSGIANIKLGPTNTTNDPFTNPAIDKYLINIEKKIELEKTTIDLLTKAASHFNIDLQDDFFYIGNLKEKNIMAALGVSKIIGTEDEKKKYELICSLKEKINQYTKWFLVNEAFERYHYIALAIENNGTDIDEDIEVTLCFSRGALLYCDSFPDFKNDIKGFLLKELDMSDLFGIGSTSMYMEYSASILNPSRHKQPVHIPIEVGSAPDYSDAYTDELNNIFRYSVFEEGEKSIIKITFDYIKHHTTIAYPAVIFVTEGDKEVSYTITSKHRPDIKNGHFTIKQ